MKIHSLLTVFVVALCALTAARSFPAGERKDATNGADAGQVAAPIPAVASDLAVYFRDTRDLHAAFTQTVYSHRGEETSSGEVWLARPGKFYWDYRRPDRQKIISDGKAVYHYDLDLEQISVRSREELVGAVAVQVLSGEIAIDEAFVIGETSRDKIPGVLQGYGENGRIYRLTPKNEREGYDAVWVVIEKGNLGAIMVDGGSGQQTVIVFNDLQRNAGIPAARFVFTPPQGVDVVGDAGP